MTDISTTAHGRIDYTRLGQRVEEWKRDYLQHIREAFGDDSEADTRADLEADPWLALRWFLDDHRPIAALAA